VKPAKIRLKTSMHPGAVATLHCKRHWSRSHGL